MIKKVIEYTDFNDTPRKETFYFNLSEAEIIEWEMRENLTGGLQGELARIQGVQDGNKIMDLFKKLIFKSYGIKSDDGRDFKKSDLISSGFMGGNAYSKLFMELLSSEAASAEFVNGIIPQGHKPKPVDETVQAPQATVTPFVRPQPQDHMAPQVHTVFDEPAAPVLEAAKELPGTDTTGYDPAYIAWKNAQQGKPLEDR